MGKYRILHNSLVIPNAVEVGTVDNPRRSIFTQYRELIPMTLSKLRCGIWLENGSMIYGSRCRDAYSHVD